MVVYYCTKTKTWSEDSCTCNNPKCNSLHLGPNRILQLINAVEKTMDDRNQFCRNLQDGYHRIRACRKWLMPTTVGE